MFNIEPNVIITGLAATVIIWPRASGTVGRMLTRHSLGMKAFYNIFWFGVKEYFRVVSESDVSYNIFWFKEFGGGHPDMNTETPHLVNGWPQD
jgi:hypothetical protein